MVSQEIKATSRRRHDLDLGPRLRLNPMAITKDEKLKYVTNEMFR